MSIVSATKFGNHNTHSMYGDVLRVNDGDGAMCGSGDMYERYLGDPRLLEIQAMYSAIAECPMSGDEQVIHLLQSEQKIIEGGEEVNFESVLQTYPDLPAYISDAAQTDMELHVQIIEVVGDEEGIKWLVEKPAEYLEQLSHIDSLKILHAVQDSAMRAQINLQKPEHALAA